MNTYDVKLDHHLMTDEEIEEAGIDTSDPSNEHVYKYELKLEYEAGIDWLSIAYYMNGFGEFLGGCSGSGSSGGSSGSVGESGNSDSGVWIENNDGSAHYYQPSKDGKEAMSVYPVSENFYLIVHGEVSWLKEMFDVEMLVVNNSKTDTLENLKATLNLPDGLSLAAMKDEQQTAALQLDNISEGGTESVHWYVRGDKAGSYGLEARLQGTVMPFEEKIDDIFKSDNQLQVLAGNALKLDFEFPSAAYYGENYPIKITLTNNSDTPLYNVNQMVQIEQGMEIYYSDGKSKKKIEKSAWASKGVDKFNPGDQIIIESSVNIFFESEVMKNQLRQMIGIVDGIETLLKMCDFTDTFMKLGTDVINFMSKAESALNFEKSTLETISLDKKKETKKLYDAISKLYVNYSTSGNKSIDKGAKLVNTGISEVLDAMASDNALDYLLKKKPEDIEKLANQILGFAQTFDNTDEDIKNFDVFDSIRTAISAIPIAYTLKNVVLIEDENNTTSIPWSYTVSQAAPQYFGVSNVGKYILSIVQAACGQKIQDSLPGIVQLLPGFDDPLNKDEAIRYVKATEKEIAKFQAKDATGEIKFNVWIERNNTETRSILKRAAFNATEDFLLSCDNETAEFNNGVLTFTGEGTISVTPQSLNGGTLHIEDSEGNNYTYVIDVVKQHECIAGEAETILAPTDDYDGYAIKCCEICGDILDIETLSVSNCQEHIFGEWKTELDPSCEVSGIKNRICENCGYTETEFINATGHTEITVNQKDATCTESGYSGDTICSVCDEKISVGKEIPALGHSFTNYVYNGNATCTADGTKTAKCDRCDVTNTVTDEGSAKGHTIVIDKAAAPTCTEAGLTEGKHCSVCNTVLVKQEVIPATGHNDNNSDEICDSCGEDLGQHTPSENCSCNCHKTGFAGFIYKIMRFFWKLFRINQTCACGQAHY